MKLLKKFWCKGYRRAWFITTCAVLLLAYIVSIVGTQVPLLYNTMSTVFGPGMQGVISGDPTQYIRYTTDEGITDKESALKAGNALNEEIASEGFTLLKNEDKALPLAEGSKVSIFGKNSVNLVYGGSGSGGMDASKAMTVADSLKQAGFSVNQKLVDFYNSSDSGGGRASTPAMDAFLRSYDTGEAPVSKLRNNSSVVNTFSQYHDAAIVVFSRIGGEGYDLPRFQDKADNSKHGIDSHYLELDKNESELLDYVCGQFDKVIVVINSSATMELGFLQEGNEDYHEQIKGAVWIGSPGGSGIAALGKLLDGEYSFSGRTVDTYVRDFTKDPTWNNISYGANQYENAYINPSNGRDNNYFVEYEEGIYVGYRYWETRGYEEGGKTGDWAWYNQNVVFPFGYGLSYAEFSWEIAEVRVNGSVVDKTSKIALALDTKIEIDVTVTNTSDFPVATKDVVQLYYSAPYTSGEIEKSYVNLADFAKTKAIAAHQTDTVTLSVTAFDMASYDYSDANHNTHKGYELDAGEYKLLICKDAHTPVATIEAEVSGSQAINIDNDPATGTPIVNRFDDVSDYFTSGIDGVRLMSRANFAGTFPERPTTAGRTSAAYSAKLSYSVNDKKSDPWYTSEMPITGKQTADKWVYLYDLIGKDYDDPLWDDLLNQLTVSDMTKLIGTGNFNTAALLDIDKPQTIEPDGPGGFTNFMAIGDNAPVYDTVFYAAEAVIGSTWSTELTYRMGVMVGNEALIGNARGDGIPYSGWYAPAANIHRSQFSGRNFEYYSEDGVLSGKMAASVVQGAATKGLYTYMKHFVLNDQETNRSSTGLITWATEQTMREIYFKPFEIAVKEGKTRGIMSSFNRLGTVWAGGSYALLTEVLRNEWGFQGSVVTDYATPNYMDADQMIRAGGDVRLMQSSSFSDTSSATAVAALRRATKNILFVTANSMAMNGHGDGVVWGQSLPKWHQTLIWVVVSLTVAVLIVDGVFLFLASRMTDEQYEAVLAEKAAKKAAKKNKKSKKEEQ